MKVLITYYSPKGYLKKIAEAVFSAISQEKTIKPMEEVESLIEYDLIFIGFPIETNTPPEFVRNFVEDKLRGKKIAIFITFPLIQFINMLKKVYKNCKDLMKSNQIIDIFSCQSELSEELAETFLNSEDFQLRKIGKLREQTIGHPNELDIECAFDFAEEVIKKALYSINYC